MLKSKYEILMLIVQKGSFSGASQEIGYTASGLNRLVDSLENDLGITIFKRTKKGLTLTEEGKAAVNYIEKIAAMEGQLRNCIDELNGFISGTLNIGTIYCIANNMLPQLVQNFTAKYPGITVNIFQGSHGELDKWLEDGKVDLIFTTKRSGTGNWISLLRDKVVVWVSKKSELAQLKKFPEKELEKHPYILTMPGENTDAEFIIQQRGIKIDAKYTSKDSYTTYKMVEAGLGISLNNSLMDKFWKDNVKGIPLEPPAFVDLGINFVQKDSLPPAARRFLEMLSNSDGVKL